MGVPSQKMSVEDYLALEPKEGVKFEWINGEMYAMSGGRPLHAAVIANTIMYLGLSLRGQPCRSSSSEQRLYIEETGAYVYPDTMVLCPPWHTRPDDVQSVTNPVVIVEVLSPSTRDYDLGAKLGHYRRVPSVRHCLFIDPHARTVAHYRRADGHWELHDLTEGSVSLDALGIELPLSDIFGDLKHVPDL